MSDTRDPIAEAGRWLDAKLAGGPVPTLLLVLGLGEGHLLEVLEARAPDTRVLALEPSPRTALAFMARRDWTPWFESGRLLYLTDPDYKGADEAWRIFPQGGDGHLFLANPELEKAPGEGAVRAARVMKDILFGVRANAEARRRFAPRYLVNSLRNLPSIVAGNDVVGLRDVFKGIPAVVAGAGPSLDAAIAELTTLPHRAVIFATDTAMRPMLHAGLSPQFAVGLDPSPANARHFHALPDCSDVWLISESALDASAVAPFDDRTFWFRVSHHHPWPWYTQLGVDVGRVEVWGSVLTGAFQAAVLAGCDPIVFVGADLAFSDSRPYCRGTTYEFEWTRAVATGKPIDQVWQEKIASAQDRSEALDLNGATVGTTQTLQSFRDWLVSRAARCGRRVINATGAGILVGDAIEQLPLSDALVSLARIPEVSSLGPTTPTRTPAAAIAEAVTRARAALASTADAAPIAQWREFCGDGFDSAAVAAALDDAGHGLAPGATRPRRAATEVFQPTAGLVGLPEREAVLRAVLTGRPIPDWARVPEAFGSIPNPARPDVFTEAATALATLLGLPGVPIETTTAGFLGEDAEAGRGTTALDQRFQWTAPDWRNVLWEYHDALALGLLSDARVPDAGVLDTLAVAVRALVGRVSAAPRACVPEDLISPIVLAQESVCGYNILSVNSGCVIASHRIGAVNLAEFSREAIHRDARAGRLLWAPSQPEAVLRIEHYVRDVLLISLVHGWATLAPRLLAATPLQGAGDAVFTALLHRLAGFDVPAAMVANLADALVARVTPGHA